MSFTVRALCISGFVLIRAWKELFSTRAALIFGSIHLLHNRGNKAPAYLTDVKTALKDPLKSIKKIKVQKIP